MLPIAGEVEVKHEIGRRLAEARWGFETPGLSGRYRGFLKLGSKKLI